MATIKSYTDINQSKKLAEILSLESADMYYPWDIDSKSFLNIPIVKDDSYYVQGSIDCWSLASLLDVLPNNYIDVDDAIKRPSLMKTRDSRYMVIYRAFQYTSHYNNPIDACVDMIEKLHELNLL